MSQAAASPQEPFLGLRSFGEHEADYFFGRNRESAELLRRVQREVLGVLFGKSGLGKSSLLRAGVFPALRREFFLPVPLRLSFAAQAGGLVTQVKAAIANSARQDGVEMPESAGAETLWEFFHRASFWSSTNRLITPILVFDQFEEIFTLGRDHPELGSFKTALADLIENRIPRQVRERLEREDRELPFAFDRQRFRVILSLREDFLPHLEELRADIPSLAKNRFRLTHLDGKQALAAVLGPGADVIEATVAEQVVRFVAGTPAEAPIRATEHQAWAKAGQGAVALQQLEVEPALLSLVCHELNRRRLDQGLATISGELLRGRRQEILQAFYERSFEGTAPPARRWVEDRLLTASGFRSTNALDDVLRMPGISSRDIDLLVERRLLRSEERLGIPHLELVHDVLTAVVRSSRGRRLQLEGQRRKFRRWLLLSGTLTFCTLLFGGLALWSARAREEARDQQREIGRRLAELYGEQGRQELLQGRWQKALVFLHEAADGLGDDPALRVLLAQALHPLEKQIATLEAAARPAAPPTACDDGCTVMAEVGRTTAADLSADQKWLAVAGSTAGIRVLQLANSREEVSLDTGKAWQRLLRFSPDASLLAALSSDGVFRVWQREDGRLVLSWLAPDARALAFSAEGNQVAIASEEGKAQVFDVGTGRLHSSLELLSYPLAAVAFDPHRPRVFAGGTSSAALWNADSGAFLLSFDVPFDEVVTTALFDPTGNLLLTAGRPSEATRLWRTDNGDLFAGLEGHTGAVVDADFSADGILALTVSQDGTARIWDSRNGKLLVSFWLDSKVVLRARFDPNANTFTTADQTGQVRRYDLRPRFEDRREIGRLIGCYIPWKLEAERLKPVEPDPQSCRRQFGLSTDELLSTSPLELAR